MNAATQWQTNEYYSTHSFTIFIYICLQVHYVVDLSIHKYIIKVSFQCSIRHNSHLLYRFFAYPNPASVQPRVLYVQFYTQKYILCLCTRALNEEYGKGIRRIYMIIIIYYLQNIVPNKKRYLSGCRLPVKDVLFSSSKSLFKKNAFYCMLRSFFRFHCNLFNFFLMWWFCYVISTHSFNIFFILNRRAK